MEQNDDIGYKLTLIDGILGKYKSHSYSIELLCVCTSQTEFNYVHSRTVIEAPTFYRGTVVDLKIVSTSSCDDVREICTSLLCKKIPIWL